MSTPTIFSDDRELEGLITAAREGLRDSQRCVDRMYGDRAYHSCGGSLSESHEKEIADAVTADDVNNLVKRLEETEKAINSLVSAMKSRGYNGN